jgi:hypothetical protein
MHKRSHRLSIRLTAGELFDLRNIALGFASLSALVRAAVHQYVETQKAAG